MSNTASSNNVSPFNINKDSGKYQIDAKRQNLGNNQETGNNQVNRQSQELVGEQETGKPQESGNNQETGRTLKTEYRHIPVMRDEVVTALTNDGRLQGKIFVDCTLGGAGHSLAIAPYLGADGMLIGIDQDAEALHTAGRRLELQNDTQPGALHTAELRLNAIKPPTPKIRLVHDNFGNLDSILLDQNITGIDAILMDLGLSSYQIDTISRGFSFKGNCPLDMRMDPNKQTLNAAKIVNSYGKDDLIRVLRKFSDERFAPQIAGSIITARTEKPITTSDELVAIIKGAIPAAARRRGGHPAKRTFQALRIEVNQELQVLKSGLDAAIRWLNPGGRIAVLSYHSLEDRIVKDTFKTMEDRCTCPPDLPKCICHKKPILKFINKKPILPSKDEIGVNPRSRSAKLRICEKL